MKLRKILTSAFVLLVCVAMLSTNVLAASVSIATGVDEDGKLKVTLSGDATGQVTFLATDASVALASVDGADIQYIDQIDKASSDRIITFAQRTGGENLVNIYAGGENVTTYASVANVYIVADAEVVDADYVYECAAIAEEFESADLTAFFTANDLVVDYRAVGSLASADAEQITFSAANADDFDFEIGEPTGSVYPVAVTYKGSAAGSVEVTAVTPSPVVSIAAEIPEYDAVVWVEEGTDADGEVAAVEAAAKDVAIVVTATREDTTTFVVDNDNLTYDVNEVEGDLVVTVSYAGFEAPQTLTFEVRERAIESAEVTVNTGVNMKVPSIADVDAGVVEEYLAENLKASEFAAKYIWNDDAETAIALSALTFTATAGEDNTWNVAVAEEKGLLNATIVVTLEEVSLTTITGSVTVQDKTAQVADDFEDAIPVGAVVTAMPYSDETMGNVTNTYDNFSAYATVVDADGNFTLEVDPGHYMVIITHTKYINYYGDIFLSRTVMDDEAVYDVTLDQVGDNYDIGTAELRYAFFGDLNADGTLNGFDSGYYTQNFGLTVPALD
ncbi:MAG: hypothetical protein IKB50_01790 [Clostridia bacterium]|nr:hypothetical protein [Clostridia bacterium]